jgi:hypothetical protein
MTSNWSTILSMSQSLLIQYSPNKHDSFVSFTLKFDDIINHKPI